MVKNMCRKKKMCILFVILAVVLNSGMYHNVAAGEKVLSATVTVLVNLNGGNVYGNTEYALVGKPGESVILANPIYEGYEFIGYHCSNGMISTDDKDHTIYIFGNTNTVITAIWKQPENLLPSELPEVTTPNVIITEIPKATELPTVMEKEEITELPAVTKEEKTIETEPPTVPAVTEEEKTTETEPSAVTEEPKTGENIIQSTEEKSVTIKTATISLKKNIYYAAYKSIVKPNVKITYNGKQLTKNKDYKITYINNSSYGKAQINIKGMGNYTGTVKKNFYILPKKVKITECEVTINSKSKIIKIIWEKSKGVAGYQIVYSKTKNGIYKEISKKSSKETSAVFCFLGKKLYIKIRPYVIIDGKYKYGKYSNVKAVKSK